MQYSITIFPQLTQPNKKHEYKISFGHLADFLTKERDAVPKKQQVSWSPYTFQGKRSNKTAQFSRLAVFDFDENTQQVEKIKKQMQNLRLQHILHTTFSHTQEKHKYRIILPLDFACAAGDQKHLYAAMTTWAEETLKMTPDRACKDAARTFFTSYRNPAGKMQTSVQEHGKIIDWQAKMLDAKLAHASEMSARREAHNKIKKTTVEELAKLRQTAAAAMFNDKPARYITRSDEKRYFYALAACDAVLREATAHKLLCNVEYEEDKDGNRIAVKATGFECPYCKRSDATFFYIDPVQSQYAYCAHVKSCSEAHKPVAKGEFRKMDLGYIVDMQGLI